MTDFNIEVIQQPSYLLEITSASGSSGGNLIEISNRDKILPSDLPNNYPISSTTGQLPISRVSGLYSGSGIIFSSGLDGSLTISVSDIAQNIIISGTSGISVNQSGNLYTIYTTGTFGLSSSQIQSLLNSGVSINVISGTGNFNSLSISGTPVSISGHSHTASSITDFNSSVSGLLPVKNILGSGYASVASSGGVFTVSVTGLQPSGNYSSSGHQHIASDITNFNSSVSGLFPITNIVGISGASVTSSGTTFTVAVTGSFGLTTSQIQSLLNSGVSISVIGGTGNFNSLSVNSVPVSTSGHSHLSSSITDFNSSVSGLIPVKNIVNSGYVVVSSSGGVFTVGVTGLQPSGNYSLSGHNHTTSNITDFNSATSGLLTPYALLNSGNFITLLVTGIPVSLSGHTHLSSQITDFNSSVSGLLPFTGILGSGYVTLSSLNRTLTIGVSGLQPSGNYSISGHQHVVADITNFNSGVSGLLPSISGGNYISILPSGNSYILSATGLQPSGNYSVSGHTHISSQITDFNSSVSSLISVKNVVGSGYVNVVSTTGLFTVSVTGLQPVGNYSLSGHTHIASNITDFNSATSGLLTPYAQLSSGNFTSLYVTGIPVSLSGHVHSTSNIINFNTEVSGLIPVKDILSGSGIQIGVNSGVYTVTAYGVAASSASSLITRCENRTGSTLPKMTVVYINGGQGNRPTIQKSIASSESGSSKTYGVTASQINDNSAGDVVVFGALIDVDTDQFGAVEGSTLYLSPSVSGNLTATKPTAPNHMVVVGKIVRNHNNQGIIEVSIQNGFELEELHNVATTGSVSGQFLKYDGGLWRNTGILSSDISDFSSAVSGLLPVSDIVAGTGIVISNIGGVFTINSSGSTSGGSSNVAISNSGVGRLLASDGTSSGIIGQSNLTFIDNNLTANGVIINNGNNLYMWSNFR